MWHEGQASRGNREISSGLLRFINEEASHAKHLIAYSDNCGGQNKSQKFVKILAVSDKHSAKLGDCGSQILCPRP